MIGSTRNVNVWAYPQPCDLRKGHNGLSGLVVTEFEADLLSGDFFIFVNRRRTLCKVLLWDIETAVGLETRGTRRYSPEFAIEVATNKYLDHLPLTRQARRMKRQGLHVTS